MQKIAHFILKTFAILIAKSFQYLSFLYFNLLFTDFVTQDQGYQEFIQLIKNPCQLLFIVQGQIKDLQKKFDFLLLSYFIFILKIKQEHLSLLQYLNLICLKKQNLYLKRMCCMLFIIMIIYEGLPFDNSFLLEVFQLNFMELAVVLKFLLQFYQLEAFLSKNFIRKEILQVFKIYFQDLHLFLRELALLFK
ncbi:hypothetical protein TTHERM_000147659 (macronuclear) [Tetrahymena thermophila SB210]|uniref:Uncharacterized protein n=1 Tax=Tetrahymena thermophila (strain SB210) TaxID=312017 RepID=W7XG13_TETTS|nr:hypothetical protein TTHERM_000147659 [Tetrahymena thermophila SB210]EWS73011.1 hypothetical protein TTHERM_000147659 [Tetrahymena thermophila SB210]|eukprot:XP_012654408.1 hypothetical protein TTHERM_000147659 [Tetrahymena thermophila SB210]